MGVKYFSKSEVNIEYFNETSRPKKPPDMIKTAELLDHQLKH